MMLTRNQLDTIKAHLNLTRKMDSDKIQLCTNISTLLVEIQHLQQAIQAKDAALAQFADSENWTHVISNEYYVWDPSTNPIELAEQALSHG